MENKKYNKNNLIIVILLIIIVILCIILFVLAKDKISTPKENTQVINNIEEINKNKDVMTKDEALTIGKQLYSYATSTFFGGKDVWPSHFVDNENGEGQTKVCDTTVEKVKEKYAKDFKFEQFYDNSDEAKYSGNIDDFVHQSEASTCGELNRGTIQNFLDSDISEPTIEENKITFKATTNYCSSSFCDKGKDIDHSLIKDFIIVKENDEWKILYYAVTK